TSARTSASLSAGVGMMILARSLAKSSIRPSIRSLAKAIGFPAESLGTPAEGASNMRMVVASKATRRSGLILPPQRLQLRVEIAGRLRKPTQRPKTAYHILQGSRVEQLESGYPEMLEKPFPVRTYEPFA